MQQVPEVTFKTRVLSDSGEYVWKDVTTSDLFTGKRVVIFSLPGAFTPTCSTYQLPGFEEKYNEFISLGIDDIYCVSVNDSFVFNAWFKQLGIENVKAIPDGNGIFTGLMNQLVLKENLGFGYRSWRYAAVVNDTVIERLWEEPGKEDNHPEDPYVTTDPQTVIEYLKSVNA